MSNKYEIYFDREVDRVYVHGIYFRERRRYVTPLVFNIRERTPVKPLYTVLTFVYVVN